MRQLPVQEFPTVIALETTSICNARCIMCVARDGVKRDPAIMPREAFEHLIDQCVGRSIHLVTLTHFGEPLLDPLIVERISYVRRSLSKGVQISLWSNGTKMTEELAGSLLDAGLSAMIFSIDSLDKTTYETIRVGLRFEDAIEGIKAFVGANEMRGHPCQVRIHATAMQLNKPEMDFFVAYWKNIVGIDSADWLPAEANRGIDPAVTANASTSEPCASPFNNFTVMSDGTAVLCCKDHDGLSRLGNAFEQPIEAIWHSVQYQEWRDLHNQGRKHEIPLCASCGARR